MIPEPTYPFLSDLDALRAAFREQIEASAAATARRGGNPARNTDRWAVFSDDDMTFTYEEPVQ